MCKFAKKIGIAYATPTVLKKSAARLARSPQILGSGVSARLCACRNATDDEDGGLSPVFYSPIASPLPVLTFWNRSATFAESTLVHRDTIIIAASAIANAGRSE